MDISMSDEAIQLYRDLKVRCHGNVALMYATVTGWAIDDAENDVIRLHDINGEVKHMIKEAIVYTFMTNAGYYQDEETHKWVHDK